MTGVIQIEEADYDKQAAVLNFAETDDGKALITFTREDGTIMAWVTLSLDNVTKLATTAGSFVVAKRFGLAEAMHEAIGQTRQ